ncbi:PREDICTED: DNA-(apurinic or apyrimidinic site) lyase [Sturnus vulgaris]|uniref:DNA-(apurinic or apyrimidinic site) lyase n=1 Tax=Sturnus vulgaris TaxID=9172 RepID=UPI00071A7519|nr:PREDICTED: DNA-(apurinic or apyrimidinic site) lyase [Sturnus vulgaris]
MPKRGKKKEESGSGDEAGPGPAKVAKAAKAAPAPLYEDPPTRETTPEGRRWTLKVTSWNVDGLRAWVRKGGVQHNSAPPSPRPPGYDVVRFRNSWSDLGPPQWVQEEAPDVLCLQETKCAVSAVPPEIRALPGLPHQFWSSAKDRPGYSGVGLLAKTEPLNVTYGIGDPEHDVDGRVVTAEFPSLFVVSAYVPNAGRGLVRLEPRQRFDAAFLAFLRRLDARKPVLLCGDLNVAHAEIDLCHPRANRANPGFTPQERDGFSRLLAAGFVDSFRHLYPEARGAFTFWTYLGGARARNVGWRLDYAVLSRRLLGSLCDSKIRSAVAGSDHCPITALLAV